MLVRIVRMTFAPDAVDDFLARFEASAPQIRAYPGCRHLELWRDLDEAAVLTTYSHWDDPQALESYRQSELFRKTWAAVTPLFADRPRAHSYEVARPAGAIAPEDGASSSPQS